MKFQFIKEHRHEHEVRSLCRVLEVTTSGFYDWLARPQSSRATTDDELRIEIREVFDESRGLYGSPRIHAELIHKGVTVKCCGSIGLRGHD